MDIEDFYKDFCDNASDMMQSVTAEAHFRYVNNAWLRTLGYKKQETTSMTVFDIIHPDELEHCRELFTRVISGENIGLINTTFVTKGGAKVFVEGHVSCQIVDGKPTYTRGIFRDVTERKQAQEALQESKEKLYSLLDSMDDLVFVIAIDGTFRDYYQPLNRRDLYVPPDRFTGKHLEDVLPSDVTKSLQAAMQTVETSGESQKLDYVLEIKGEKLWYEAKISPIRDRSGIVTAVTAVCRNITERKRLEENIRHLAYFDGITGLPNRALFNDRLKVALARAKRNKEKLAIMMLDLDKFKTVNDTLGHETGDQLLQAVGNRLKGALRESDTISRMGGDEFMVLLPSITYEKSVIGIVQKILCSFREPFRVRDREFHVTASVGISLYPEDGTDSATLIKNADVAMYRSKAKGGNTSQQFGFNTSTCE